jgi:hypothetical protein
VADRFPEELVRFRFRDGRGKVTSLPDVASLVKAIRSGAIGPETSLAIGKERGWHRADTVAAYREAIGALGRVPPERYPSQSARGEARDSGTPRRSKLRSLVLLAGVIVLGIGLRAYLGRQTVAPPPPAKATVTGLRAGARLRVYSFQFGDSVALELRHLEDWLVSQRFGAKLRGAALKRPASLMAARTVSAGYLLRVDSMASRSRELARRLIARADALEGEAKGFDGLATALEDELAVWSREFSVQLEILRGLAAAMDSVPAFLLEKQGSFAIWEGKAAFLSRDDGARFATLEARFAEIAARERSWSSTLLAKRPDWMAGVLEDERPRFGLWVLASQ